MSLIESVPKMAVSAVAHFQLFLYFGFVVFLNEVSQSHLHF